MSDPGASERLDETVVGGEEYERVVEPHPAGSKVGRYVILDRVGQGGMGVVYSAFDPELNRRIALKILHGVKHGATGHSGPPRQRLLREAQAIAQVSHPNVISVFDVGTVGDSVFVAMEFVAGSTLTQWQARETDLAKIVAVYAAAGRGLAAAHAAGIVHRDFKPDNVLISPDGRAHVLDFGLARAAPSASAAGVAVPEYGDADSAPIDLERSDILDSPLTLEGAVVGTPRFMAPEQHAGVAADARSDQFSFCVALYQAVYRQDPFLGATLERLALAKQRGQICHPGLDARVPAHIEMVIMRGLSPQPSERWDDMVALVTALTFDAAASRRGRLLALGTIGLVAAAATAGVLLAPTDTPNANELGSQCSSAGRLADVWDDTRRAELRAAFGAVAVPYAEQATGQAIEALDDYAMQWLASYDDACVRHDRHEQSTGLFDRRMQCLAQRRQGFAAVVEVFASGDAEVVQRAGQATSGLAPLEPCDSAEYLLAAIEPPPAVLEVEVAAVRASIAGAQALAAAGRTKPAREQAEQAVKTADELAYAPLRAEARARHAALLEAFGEYAAAEDELHEALQLATTANHDEVAASVARDLASVVGDRRSRHAEGLRWAGLAGSLLQRLALGGLARARLDIVEGNILYRMGDLAAAELSYDHAIELTEQLRGVDDPLLATWLVNLGNVYYRQNRRELTLATFERAAAISEAAYGASHPSTAYVYFGLANALTALERWDDAERLIESARTVYRAAFGDTHPVVIACVCNLGVVEEGRRRLAKSLEKFAECSTLTAAHVGREHPDFALSLYNLGRLHRETGELIKARSELDEALAIRLRVLGADHRETLDARAAAAMLRWAEGDLAGAALEFEAVIEAMERVGDAPLELAAARFAYARVQALASGASEVGLARARAAREAYVKDGPPSALRRAEVEDWLGKSGAANPGRRVPEQQ